MPDGAQAEIKRFFKKSACRINLFYKTAFYETVKNENTTANEIPESNRFRPEDNAFAFR